MKEARITCTCHSLKLPDLGLDLVKGQVEIIAEAAARKSKDLARARAGVTVEYIERFQTRRDPVGSRR